MLYVYAANLSAGRFFGLISGIFLLYEPVKTLSRIHIVMQRSIARDDGFLRFIDSEPDVQDTPDAHELPHFARTNRFRDTSPSVTQSGVTDAIRI